MRAKVHVFTGKLSSLRGDPTETEEMRPKVFHRHFRCKISWGENPYASNVLDLRVDGYQTL